MKIKTWHPGMSDKETADLAYWERNALALYFADGWYNDDVPANRAPGAAEEAAKSGFGLIETHPRFTGWRRALTLAGGTVTFHIPDDFEVGILPKVTPNWDGHTTEQKWARILKARGIVT